MQPNGEGYYLGAMSNPLAGILGGLRRHSSLSPDAVEGGGDYRPNASTHMPTQGARPNFEATAIDPALHANYKPAMTGHLTRSRVGLAKALKRPNADSPTATIMVTPGDREVEGLRDIVLNSTRHGSQQVATGPSDTRRDADARTELESAADVDRHNVTEIHEEKLDDGSHDDLVVVKEPLPFLPLQPSPSGDDSTEEKEQKRHDVSLRESFKSGHTQHNTYMTGIMATAEDKSSHSATYAVTAGGDTKQEDSAHHQSLSSHQHQSTVIATATAPGTTISGPVNLQSTSRTAFESASRGNTLPPLGGSTVQQPLNPEEEEEI